MKEIKEIYINELNVDNDNNQDILNTCFEIDKLNKQIFEVEETLLSLKNKKEECINHILNNNITAVGIEKLNARFAFTPSSNKVNGIDYAKTFKGCDLDTVSRFQITREKLVQEWDDELIKKELGEKVLYKETNRAPQVRITLLDKEKGGEQ